MQKYQPPGGDIAAYQPEPSTMTTPAQARVEAVSTLLHAAYQRASTLVLTPEQDQALSADFPDEAFKPGAAGKEHLIYIEHAHLRDRFNQVFGRGQWTMMRTRPHWAEEYRTAKGTQATRIYCEAALLIKGCYVGEAIGDMSYFPNNDSQNYGDAAEGAMTAAFRRCAKNFGVGLQAWKKDFGEGWKQRQRTGAQTPAQQLASAPAPAQSAPAPQSRPAATAQQATGGATIKTREWMMAKLSSTFSLLDLQKWAVENQVIKAGGVLATDWPLSMVPSTGAALRELTGRIQGWIDAQAKPAATEEPPGDEPPQDGLSAEVEDMSQPFWNVMITVPRAGTKKQEYLQAPDTIRSLYDAIKTDEKCRHRLFGLAKEWSPQSYVYNGQTYQPSKNDLLCREALDQFLDWHGTKGT